MSSDQMPAPGKIKLIKFPPPGQEKTSNARGMPGGGGMLKLRFDWYIRYKKTKGSCSIPFALREKQKNQDSNVRVKSKIVTFASQRIIKFKQFLTRPNLACSVAKTDHRFFSILMFHETISN